LLYEPRGAPGGLPTSGRDDDRGLSLTLASLAPAERQRLLDLVRNATARLETRLSPLGTDLGDDDEDPVKQLRKDAARYMPSLTAARELDRGWWRSADLTVRAAESCLDAKNNEVCVPMYVGRESAGLEGRARFLAWVVASSAIVEAPTDEAREDAARKLRDRTAMGESTIALVLDQRALAFEPVPERDELSEAARRLGRAMAANERHEETRLESLGRRPPAGRSAPWLQLAPHMLLVVPRLSAAVRREEFATEIDSIAKPFTWVYRPQRL
jgi:hypothetical protein